MGAAGGNGYLPNDRRHLIKLRGAYALTEHWEFGATLGVRSGRPISAFGVGNPFDARAVPQLLHLRSNCSDAVHRDRTYTSCTRAARKGRTPWTFDLGANVSFNYPFSVGEPAGEAGGLQPAEPAAQGGCDERLRTAIGSVAPDYGLGTGYQDPRYATLTFKLDF